MSQEERGEQQADTPRNDSLSEEVRELACLLAAHDHEHGLPPKSRRKINWEWIRNNASSSLLLLMNKKKHLHCYQRNPIIAMVPSLKYKAFRELRDVHFSRIQTKHGLTDEQLELARLLEEIKAQNKPSNRVFDWVYIHKKASLRLMAYINEKRKNVTFERDAMRHLVGDSRRKAFAEYRLELRKSMPQSNQEESPKQRKEPKKQKLKEQSPGAATKAGTKPHHNLLRETTGKALQKFPPVYAVKSRTKGPGILSDELMELAELLEQIKESESTKVFDWDYIDAHASPKLKTFIEEKRTLATFHKNTLRCLVPQAKLEAFAAYRRQLRGPKTVATNHSDSPSRLPASLAMPLKKRRHTEITLSEEKGDLESDTEAEKSDYPTSVARLPPSQLEKSVDERRVARRPSRRRIPLHLSEDLKELAVLWELSAMASQDGRTPDWTNIARRASPRLKGLIKGKKKSRQFQDDPSMILVPAWARKDFEILRAQVRMTPEDFEQDIAKHVASVSDEATDDSGLELDESAEEEGAMLSPSHLSSVHKELAELFVLAREQNKTWNFIESNASSSLRRYIVEKAKNPVYLEAPLRCLVPRELTISFHSYCAEVAKVEVPPARAKRKRGDKKDSDYDIE